jgi:O-antigen ligase
MQRPLLGIGPGVFQYVYGPVAGLSRWDTRIHTNNLYLELLVGGGVWVLLSFVVLIGQTLRQGMQYLRQYGAQSIGSGAWWGMLASMLGMVAFLLHGVLDAFIAFMTTNLLLWVLIGVVVGITTQPQAKEQV